MKAPSAEELSQAHQIFTANELRGFVYTLAIQERERSMVNAILLLLLVWNRDPYRMLRGAQFFRFLKEHKNELQNALNKTNELLDNIRNDIMESITIPEQSEQIGQAFTHLCRIRKIGPTAAGKILHLLLPELFVMWDEKIRKGYNLSEIEKAGLRTLQKVDYIQYYSRAYVSFLAIMQDFAKALTRSCDVQELLRKNDSVTLPKLLDEYNYCVYTLRLMPTN